MGCGARLGLNLGLLDLLDLHLQRLRRRILSPVVVQLRRVVRYARRVEQPCSRADRSVACRRARRRLLRGGGGAIELPHMMRL